MRGHPRFTTRYRAVEGAAAWLDGRIHPGAPVVGLGRHRLRHGQPDGVLADLADALDVRVCLTRAGDRAHGVCLLDRHATTSTMRLQGTGIAHGQWEVESAQMAYPNNVSRRGDALE